MNKEVSIEHRPGLAFEGWLSGGTMFAVQQSAIRDRNALSKFWFEELAPQTDMAPSWA